MIDSVVWFGSFIFLLGFHFLLQSRSYHVWPDWDSASHLYYAFLRQNAINVLASYSFGIKWGLPRLYQVLGKFWLGKFWDHRILNTIAGAVLLAQFAWVGDRGILPDDFLFLLCVVLVINSLYVNYQTSATEFLDTPFLLLVLTLSAQLPTNFLLLIPMILVIGIAFTSKAVDFAYVLPIFATHHEGLLQQPFLLGILCLSVLIGVVAILKFGVKGSKTYTKSRGILHPKGMKYILSNPAWVTLNIVMTIEIVSQLELLSSSILAAAWLCLVFQKMPVAYFWYPLAIFNLYFYLDLGLSLSGFGELLAMIVLLWLAVGSAACIFLPKKYIEPITRQCFMGSGGISRYRQVESEQRAVSWLNENIDSEDTIYLWGSQASLPLMSQLKHLAGVFYNHNHLFYWSDLKDKPGYARDIILKFRPRYILEAGIVETENFPEEEFRETYQLYAQMDGLRVFKHTVNENT